MFPIIIDYFFLEKKIKKDVCSSSTISCQKNIPQKGK